VEPRTRWTRVADYHTVELLFDGTKVICKDWWDPGHDRNCTELSVSEFLAGALHDTIIREMGRSVLDEALDTVDRLTTGGPGVAEPPD
jgi:hypothetical protein